MYNYLGPTIASKGQNVKNIKNENIHLEPDDNNNREDELLLEDTQSLDYGDFFADDPVQSVEKTLAANKCDENLNSG